MTTNNGQGNEAANAPNEGNPPADPTKLAGLIAGTGITAKPPEAATGDAESGVVPKSKYVELQKAHTQTKERLTQLETAFANIDGIGAALKPVVDALTTQAAESEQLRAEQVAERIGALMEVGDEKSLEAAKKLATRENARLIPKLFPGVDPNHPSLQPLREADPLQVFSGLILVGSPLRSALSTVAPTITKPPAADPNKPPENQPAKKVETEAEMRSRIENETAVKFGIFNFTGGPQSAGGPSVGPTGLDMGGSLIRQALDEQT